MNWKNTDSAYGLAAKGFHWIVAVLVIGLLCLGLYMADLEPNPFKFNLYFWHKSFGIAVLALMLARLGWKLSNTRPEKLATHKPWEKTLASIAHALLYALAIAMPLSGWIMSSAKGFSVSVFGLFTLPDLVAENKAIGALMAEFHETAAWIVIALLALHIGGALKHHFIDRDSTLRRMLPLMVFCLALPSAAHAGAVSAWAIDPAASSLTFEGTQMGAPFTGTFGRFSGDIVFDPGNLAESRASIAIPLAGATSGSSDRDKYMQEEAWFNTAASPAATFVSESFEKSSDGQYVCRGKLTLRGVTLPVTLPFSLEIETDAEGRKTAKAAGQTTLLRLDYGIGSGQWKDTSSVGNEVIVKFSLTAHEKAH